MPRLWFVIAVDDLLAAAAHRKQPIGAADRRRLEAAVLAIVEGYSHGMSYGIRMDADELLAAGEPGVQLTWMDAKFEDWVVTPRIGKPVEVQALWLNALWIASRLDAKWKGVFERGHAEFEKRFWNAFARLLVRRGRRRSPPRRSRRLAAPQSNLRHRRPAARAD